MKSSYTLFMLMLFFIGFSQEKKIKEANAAFEKLGYMNAVSIYIEVDKNGYGSPDIYKKIADSYYFNANYSEANVWYEKLIKSTEDVDYEYYYRYSQTLKTVPDLEKSNYYYALFSRMKKADSRAQQFEAQSNYLSQIKTSNIFDKDIIFFSSKNDVRIEGFLKLIKEKITGDNCLVALDISDKMILCA